MGSPAAAMSYRLFRRGRSTAVLRVFLGLLFAYAGAVKFADLGNFFAGLMQYDLIEANGAWLASRLIPAAEVLLGLWLLAGWKAFYASLLGAAMVLLFTAALVSAWARGMEIGCACFGPLQIGASYPSWFLRNALLLAAFAWLSWRCRPSRLLM